MVACGHVSVRESPASVARTPSGGDPAAGTHPEPRATSRPPAAIGHKDPAQDVRLAMNRWRPDLRDEECTMTTSVSKDSPDFHPASSAATATVSQVEALTGDYDEAIVPQDKRRSKTAMFLIWATLQASISVIYTVFLARAQGLSFCQLMIACAVGTVSI